jgi:hypothetical protein
LHDRWRDAGYAIVCGNVDRQAVGALANCRKSETTEWLGGRRIVEGVKRENERRINCYCNNIIDNYDDVVKVASVVAEKVS